MGQRTLVPDAGEVALGELKIDGNSRLVMVLRPSGKESRCPSCGQPSRRLHSRYSRRLSDLPWEGIPVRIELRVRRFFCGNKDCGQAKSEKVEWAVQNSVLVGAYKFSPDTLTLSALLIGGVQKNPDLDSVRLFSHFGLLGS